MTENPVTENPVVLTGNQAGVRTLTINRPDKLNAVNDEVLLTLSAEIVQANADPAVRIIVVTGAGRGFCAGQDLSEVSSRSMSLTEHLNATFNPLVRAMQGSGKPVISAVNGVAAGAGASLALAGDIRLWAQSAMFTQIFSNIALIPDSGSTWFLPRLVGYNKAFELMALADKVGAADGLRLGLCEAVYPDETFRADVQAYAERLASRPANALKLTKQALVAAMTSSLDNALALEATLQQGAGDSWEHAEGVKAFREKRAADFLKQQ